MSKVVRIYETGSSEVMKFEDIHIHEPGDGEVKIEHTAIGLNYYRNFNMSESQYMYYNSDSSNPTNIEVNPLPTNKISLDLETMINNNFCNKR